MAEAAGSREHQALPAHKGEEDTEMYPELGSLDLPAAAMGRRRERRSGVSVASAERFPSSLAAPAASDSEASLLEAARATPRRSSIIKVRQPLEKCLPSHVALAQHCAYTCVKGKGECLLFRVFAGI
uniref:Uncharacterized protein n=1 Tax=Salvator merianae TaxID=96440 RepID=A0A8D0KMN5_SALMN